MVQEGQKQGTYQGRYLIFFLIILLGCMLMSQVFQKSPFREQPRFEITASQNEESELALVDEATNMTDFTQGQQDRNSSSTCSDGHEKQKIYYLKVHKTGSTTMRNILQRFALERNLTMPITFYQHTYPSRNIVKYLLPLQSYWDEFLVSIRGTGQKNYKTARKKLLQLSDEVKVRENQCDILAVHTVFDKEEVLKLFPEDVLFTASIRHPLEQMISSFNHWNLAAMYRLNKYEDPIEEFLKNPHRYDRILPASLYNAIAKIEHLDLSYTRNYVAYEFGFDLKRVSNKSYVEHHLKHINETFEVVVLTERFSESLILLKRKMCWTFKDIIYIPLRNTHRQRKIYDTKLLMNHREWTQIDYMIYDMFLSRHMNLIKNGGQELQREIQIFNNVLGEVSAFCDHVSKIIKQHNSSSWYEAARKEIRIAGNAFSDEFIWSGADCVVMTLSERRLCKFTKAQRYPQFCDAEFAKFLDYMGCQHSDIPGCAQNKMKYNIPYTEMKNAFWLI